MCVKIKLKYSFIQMEDQLQLVNKIDRLASFTQILNQLERTPYGSKYSWDEVYDGV